MAAGKGPVRFAPRLPLVFPLYHRSCVPATTGAARRRAEGPGPHKADRGFFQRMGTRGAVYFFRGFLMAACAAASRAMGTRKGLQDT